MSRRSKKSRAVRTTGVQGRGVGRAGGHLPRIEALEDRTLLAATYLPPQYNLINYDGYLTGPSNEAPLAIAENFLRASATDLGILPDDLNDAIITTNYSTTTTGATTLTLQQSLHGLPVFNANYNITVADDGRILYVGGGFVPGLSERAQQPRPNAGLTGRHSIDSVAEALGTPLTHPPVVVNGSNTFRAPSLSLDDITTSLQYVAIPGNDVALAWNLTARMPDSSHWYNVSVDASSGEVLTMVDFSHDATYEVFAVPNENPDDGSRTIETDPDIFSPTPATVPSPFGWHDTDGAAGAELTITSGNNVNAYADRDGDNTPDADSQPDGGAELDFTGALVPLDLTQAPETYTDASVVNLFYWNNVLHDIHYLYGFDEASGNFQVNNYGRGGLAGDAVNAEAQDGSGTNNANFATPPDGMAPRMQMFEFTFTTPNRDSAFDNGIVIHEYGHGVSNRLTGNAFGLQTLQSRGMGEGWSDWWGLMLTQEAASETTDGRGGGTYVLGQPLNGPGGRDFKYDFDITDPDLETFEHFGTGPGQSVQVHATGTRWSAALWDINHLFIEKYGFEQNIYNSTSDAGNIRALHLVMNALKIQALNPTFIQARDAVLMADQLLYGGANEFEIWTAFARRGLGEFAATSGSSSPVLTTSFEIPEQLLIQFSVGPDLALLEGDGGTTSFVFFVSADRALEQSITVTFETADGTALADSDYTPKSATLTFPAGPASSTPVTIEVSGDTTVEENEIFFVRLIEVSFGVVSDGEAIGTILNDDIDVSINDATLLEGDSGTNSMVFTISIFGSVNEDVSISYTTVNNTADAATDYLPRAGVLTLTPQTTSGSIAVPILGDTENEPTEHLFLSLVAAEGVRIDRSLGTGTILDDDSLPALYVGDVHVTSSSSSASTAVFTIALDEPSGRDVVVEYATADGNAVESIDYVGQSGIMTFPAGTTHRQVNVPIIAGAGGSPDKTFFLNLTSPNHALVGDPSGVATIHFGAAPADELIVDNGGAGFSGSGNGWANLTNTLAHGLDYAYHAAGGGGATATWTFTAITNGSYEVFAHWIPFVNRATDAPYTIIDGSAALGTALDTVSVNQQAAPAGDEAGGFSWQSLGTYGITSNTLTVRLSDNANGLVIADAIRIVGDGITPQFAAIDISGGNQSIGAGDAKPADGNGTEFGAVEMHAASAAHVFTITNTGNADLALTGSPAVVVSGANAADFVVTAQPAPAIQPRGATTFQIQFQPGGSGTRQAVVAIANNGQGAAPYTFMVQGTGMAEDPLVAHNVALPQDVNDDSRVSPLDALLIINKLLVRNAAPAAAPLAAESGQNVASTHYVDVSGDGRVSPIDVLMVINYLLAGSAAPSAAPAAATSTQGDSALAAVAVDQAIRLSEGSSDEAPFEPLRIESVLRIDVAEKLPTPSPAVLTDAAVDASLVDDDEERDEAAFAATDLAAAFPEA